MTPHEELKRILDNNVPEDWKDMFANVLKPLANRCERAEKSRREILLEAAKANCYWCNHPDSFGPAHGNSELSVWSHEQVITGVAAPKYWACQSSGIHRMLLKENANGN